MPVALPNLYCTGADVQDYLSTEGVELRLDDHNQGTGQQLTVTIDAALGATSISVAAIEAPLPNGCVLNFDGGGMDAVVQVFLTASAVIGATSLSVLATTGAVNAGAFAFDNGVNIATNARVLKARSYGTARVKLYASGRYDDDELVQSWSVNNWATIIAARWLSKRRAQGCPQGIEDDYKEAMEELAMVRAGTMSIEDINTRTSSWPAFSNISMDLTYDMHRSRVESSWSEPTPTQYGQFMDWFDASGQGGWW